MIRAHKVLAAYACLVPRLVTGQFDPDRATARSGRPRATTAAAAWPSPGPSAGHGVAVLPEGMSQERFDWLQHWVAGPGDDIVRTPGVESNVKEIYDRCNRSPRGRPRQRRVQPVQRARQPPRALRGHRARPRARLPGAWGGWTGPRRLPRVNATGSAGTLAAGDHLEEATGSLRAVAAEALQCPTLLYNGFGAHNIQGIGDKHVPLIHNVMAGPTSSPPSATGRPTSWS